MANKVRKTRKAPEIRFRFDSAADAKIVAERLDMKSNVKYSRTGRTIAVSEDSIKSLDSAAKAEAAYGVEIAGRGRPKAGEESSVRTVGAIKTKTKTKKSIKSKGTKSEPKMKNRKGIKRLAAVAAKKHNAKPDKTTKSKKVNGFVVLFPSSPDAKRVGKLLANMANMLKRKVTVDGARVVISDGDELATRKSVKAAASRLSLPFVLESGFKASKQIKAKKTTGKQKKRPEVKKLKKPSERTKPVWKLEVKSSTIDRAWYNVEAKRLTIEFNNGTKYVYEKVSLKEFVAFTTAESQGEWFHAHIKDVKEFTKRP